MRHKVCLNGKMGTVIAHPIEGGGFWGEAIDYPGCITHGITIEDLLNNFALALESWGLPQMTKEEAQQFREIQEIEESADDLKITS